jgi:hypothetical protein
MRVQLQHGVAHVPSGARVPPWLADRYLESYLRWREECAATRRAYALWNGAQRPTRALAFAAYTAALDREEQAAHTLRGRLERIRRWLA